MRATQKVTTKFSRAVQRHKVWWWGPARHGAELGGHKDPGDAVSRALDRARQWLSAPLQNMGSRLVQGCQGSDEQKTEVQ